MSAARLAYRCPRPECGRAPLEEHPGGLACARGHHFAFAEGSRVPVFDKLPEDANEYAHARAAEKHDNAWRWVLATFRADEPTLRESLVGRLRLRRGDRVLVTGAGAGNDLPYLARHLDGAGEVYAQDIAQQMLLTAVARHEEAVRKTGVNARFSVSDATQLPFADAEFDAAYHFGGINLFTDIRTGIAEMNRVVKPGGRVVIGDEGLAPWLRETELGRMLVNNNALYGCEAPLALLPATVRNPRLTWELCNTFYVVEFDACRDPLPVDLDVPHVGTRGGSVRKRWSGRLEGVDPALRDRLYAQAECDGMSRVDLLERILRSALDVEDPERGGR